MNASTTLRLPDNLKVITFTEKWPDIAKKASVYARLLGTYLRHNADYVDQLNALFEGGDQEALRAHIHALKGSSGNLGIYRVFECASRLETRIREGEGVSAENVDDFSQLVLDSFEDAQRVIEANTEMSCELAEVVSLDDVRSELIAKLENHSLIEASMIKAFQRAACQHWPEAKVSAVIEHLEHFDYDEALEALRRA